MKNSDNRSPEAKTTDAKSADAGHAESDARASRRTATHLRVVTDNDVVVAGAPEPVAEDGRPAQRIGAYIRTARENQGLTLEQVSKETRITVSHLRAIEDMTPNLIGVPVYVQGHVRTYARHLKLDADAILARYKSECAMLSDPEKHEIAPPVTGKKSSATAPVLGIMLVLLVGAGGYVLFSNGEQGASGPAPAGREASNAAPAASAPAVVTPALRIVALQRAHIEVRSSAGDKFLDREFAAGESYTPRVGAGWTVSVQDGAAFEWRLGDQSLGLFAAEGGPVYAQSVDIAATRPPIDLPPPVVAETVAPPVTAGPPVSTPAVAAPRPRPAATQPTASESEAAEPAPTPTVDIAPPTPQSDPSLQAYPDN